jgi:hypothetical protein
MLSCRLLIAGHLKLFAPCFGTNGGPINSDHFETWFLHPPENTSWPGQLFKSDGMRRPVSGRDAVGSQVIDALEAQKIKETGNEEG